jgi:hypothetical protein
LSFYLFSVSFLVPHPLFLFVLLCLENGFIQIASFSTTWLPSSLYFSITSVRSCLGNSTNSGNPDTAKSPSSLYPSPTHVSYAVLIYLVILCLILFPPNWYFIFQLHSQFLGQ